MAREDLDLVSERVCSPVLPLCPCCLAPSLPRPHLPVTPPPPPPSSPPSFVFAQKNHLTGLQRRLLKISFWSQDQLQAVRGWWWGW